MQEEHHAYQKSRLQDVAGHPSVSFTVFCQAVHLIFIQQSGCYRKNAEHAKLMKICSLSFVNSHPMLIIVE